MLRIKRIPTIVSNYQREEGEEGSRRFAGCGRNCLNKCCIPVVIMVRKRRTDLPSGGESSGSQGAGGGHGGGETRGPPTQQPPAYQPLVQQQQGAGYQGGGGRGWAPQYQQGSRGGYAGGRGGGRGQRGGMAPRQYQGGPPEYYQSRPTQQQPRGAAPQPERYSGGGRGNIVNCLSKFWNLVWTLRKDCQIFRLLNMVEFMAGMLSHLERTKKNCYSIKSFSGPTIQGFTSWKSASSIRWKKESIYIAICILISFGFRILTRPKHHHPQVL